MFRQLFEYLFSSFLRTALWFRYRIKVVGLEKIQKENLEKAGGVIFLTNHPTVFLDPIIAGLSVFPTYKIRPMIIDYMYNAPVFHGIARFLNAVSIPNFYDSSNSLKRKRGERAIKGIAAQLQKGDHFMIAPAGKVKKTPVEAISGTSAVHSILSDCPEANVVLIRTKGLYGSAFSTYYTGASPSIKKTLFWGVKQCLKNLIFFMPRREVIVEIEKAAADFPYKSTRVELNRYLENWFNRPDGLSAQQGEFPGDTLVQVSYSAWGNVQLPVAKMEAKAEEEVRIEGIDEAIQQKVKTKIAELSSRSSDTIKPEMDLGADLGLDSLDLAEISVFLKEQYEVEKISGNQLTSVAKVMALAAHRVIVEEQAEEQKPVGPAWFKKSGAQPLKISYAETIPEAFLENCERMGKAVACADEISGVVTYPTLKLRVVLLAEYIRKLPGEYIGILLPASVAANVLIIATQLAGKIPLPLNWTVGPRHLETVLKLSSVEAVLTSMAFLDRLENVDLDLLEPYLIMLEDVRKELSLFEKLKAFMRTKQSNVSILKTFKADLLDENSQAVLLFTSGTESLPKGVPLTHGNLMSDLRASVEAAKLNSNDILLGMLPPFHSFGFTISGICGLLCGLKVVYSPNPTDGKKLANTFEKWKVTLLVGAPMFIKGLLASAKPGQLKTMRICITGAEKAPQELFKKIADIGGTLLEGYGITECSPVLTLNPLEGKHKGVGKPLSGIEICIVHPETLEALPVNTQGLILAKGSNVFSGYLNKDVASPFVFCGGSQWYKTGDLGYLDEEGYLTIGGRLKRFIKVGGEMVSLVAIEDVLSEACISKGWPAQQEGPALAVCAREIAGEKTKIHLFSCFEVSVEEINSSLKESGFSNLVRISSITKLYEIPLTGSGKINYAALEGALDGGK